MKKVIITEHNLGRLANQLWQYISVYAFCLEHNYECYNIAFFEYKHYFDKLPFLKITQLFEQINSFSVFVSKKYGRYVGYIFLFLYIRIIRSFNKSNIIYFSDWSYRNPKGIKKFRADIIRVFRPINSVWKKINSENKNLRKLYKYVIGVHIRKGDYRNSNWKHLYFEDCEIALMLNNLLKNNNFPKKDVCFLICSDEKINNSIFSSLNIFVSKGTPVEDLYKLSLTDTIIGSDSTFGAFASYYGNIPYIVFDKVIDWKYYENKNSYFENKFNTTVQYQADKISK